eukprot:11971667-Heterocapsa_arctica.AAC.1
MAMGVREQLPNPPRHKGDSKEPTARTETHRSARRRTGMTDRRPTPNRSHASQPLPGSPARSRLPDPG